MCSAPARATHTTYPHMAQETGTQPDWDLCTDMAQEADRESPKRKAEVDVDVPAAKQRVEEPPPKTLVNLMPHMFHCYSEEDGSLIASIASHSVLRTENVREPKAEQFSFDGLTLFADEDVPQQLKAEDVEQLSQHRGCTVIVSRIAAEVLAQRVRDKFDPFGFYVVSPSSAPNSAVRDSTGAIIGVRRVLRWGWC